jgi:hypothetical protein
MDNVQKVDNCVNCLIAVQPELLTVSLNKYIIRVRKRAVSYWKENFEATRGIKSGQGNRINGRGDPLH